MFLYTRKASPKHHWSQPRLVAEADLPERVRSDFRPNSFTRCVESVLVHEDGARERWQPVAS